MYLYNVGTVVIIWLIVLGAINAGISNGSIGMIFLGVIILISTIAVEQIRKEKNKGKQKKEEWKPIQETKTNLEEQSPESQNEAQSKERIVDENTIKPKPTSNQKEPKSSKIKDIFANIGWFFLVLLIIMILSAIFEFLKSLFGFY
ncbi:hypothetical protein HWHPT5561_08610 [Petrotoga sp. HWH.PT.55.6.1]|jgi:Na+/melibiose symporter-like transporter|uniref:hypothetical protein n=1 Tax=unclassified Petrotoga TaxID=2620614 RepID=UPI000CA070C2|nr:MULTISPECIES: hypothetical protein [unclassified Petrotoga]PNR94435.1 hypothetical protein X926_00390 [Petrotoga sp. HWHPT.55.6.3]RPD35381.1 hypothetical protein HWHPT5561_08610 [Petrotoga sp. HWH.PT.55.6.1]